MGSPRLRLDELLVERGLAKTRAEARALILEGRVFSGQRRLEKAGTRVPPDLPLALRQGARWVSRGGAKLAHALEAFTIDVRDRVAIDIGASTGGFTDVLLRAGAARVYAVDVGYGQLDWKLRNDPRVVVRERTNARYLSEREIPEPVDLLVSDASFISLEKLLPAPLRLLKPGGLLVALIKPQFEVGRKRVGKGGVVRDPALHAEVCARIRSWLGEECGYRVLGLVESPLLGPRGNREFLICARKPPSTSPAEDRLPSE